jgi:hypothetical protein
MEECVRTDLVLSSLDDKKLEVLRRQNERNLEAITEYYLGVCKKDLPEVSSEMEQKLKTDLRRYIDDEDDQQTSMFISL